jgi:hypothetical protein
MVVPPEPKRQTCYLALPDDEVPIPIRMVKRLDVPDDDTVR